MRRTILAIGVLFFLVVSLILPIVFGYNISVSDKETKTEYCNFDRYLYPEFYDCYNVDEIPDYVPNYSSRESSNIYNAQSVEINNPEKPIQQLDGPMDSPWPMYCHDTRHTGRSPYSTVDTWDEIWKFETKGWADSSPAIDSNGIIYIGSWYFYAVYPNGTLKWRYSGGLDSSCPAINENGIIYIGTDSALCAIYSDGSTKWTYPASGIESSPVIGDDGTIYFADTDNWNINALYPDGLLKWSYPTNNVIYSSPAIGLDGTIFCGSHDGNVYALYPNNGTLKWKYDTGSWVHGSPTIAGDGTVYIGSDNGYLYAFYPDNGTVKWQYNIGASYASPALDKDGTLYIGVWEKTFYAIYPNGTIKWSFNTGGGKIWGSSAAISEEGTIYFGTCDLENTGGIEFIALYSDGTVKWRKELNTFFSSPAIGGDGTVYIGSSTTDDGYLCAFGRGELKVDANGPYYGLINDPVQFEGKVTGGYSPYSYHWTFGDGKSSDEQNPTHTYTEADNYSVTLTVTDNTGNTSSDTTYAWIQTSNTPPNQPNITGETNGNVGTFYDYTFTATDPEGAIIWYYVEWADDTNTGWIGPVNSGQQMTLSHSWSKQGTYVINAKSKDLYNEEGPWGTLTVIMPRSKVVNFSSLFLKLLEKFPLLEKLLNLH